MPKKPNPEALITLKGMQLLLSLVVKGGDFEVGCPICLTPVTMDTARTHAETCAGLRKWMATEGGVADLGAPKGKR